MGKFIIGLALLTPIIFVSVSISDMETSRQHSNISNSGSK